MIIARWTWPHHFSEGFIRFSSLFLAYLNSKRPLTSSHLPANVSSDAWRKIDNRNSPDFNVISCRLEGNVKALYVRIFWSQMTALCALLSAPSLPYLISEWMKERSVKLELCWSFYLSNAFANRRSFLGQPVFTVLSAVSAENRWHMDFFDLVYFASPAVHPSQKQDIFLLIRFLVELTTKKHKRYHFENQIRFRGGFLPARSQEISFFEIESSMLDRRSREGLSKC